MIARIIFLLIPMIILSDLYIERHCLRHRSHYTRLRRLVWWLPGFIMLVYSLALTFCGKCIPDNINWIKAFLSYPRCTQNSICNSFFIRPALPSVLPHETEALGCYRPVTRSGLHAHYALRSHFRHTSIACHSH